MSYLLTLAFFLCRDGSDLRNSAPIVARFVSDEEGLVATGCIRDNEPIVLAVLLDEMCCVDIDRWGIPPGCPSIDGTSIGGGWIRKFRGRVLVKSRSSSM